MASLLPGETYGMPNSMGGVGGLLSNPALQIGLGILANNNSRNLGQVLGRGALQGLGNIQQQQAFQMQQNLLNMQLERARQEQSQAQKRQEALSQVAQDYNLNPNLISAFPEIGESVIKNKVLPKQKKIAFTPSGDAYDENDPQLDLGKNYGKPEAPKTRTVRIGAQEVTQEWNPQTMQWSEVGRGQAFKSSPDSVTNVITPKDTFKYTTDLRKEFEGLDPVQKYRKAYPAFEAVRDAASRNTPQSDINLVYGIAKLYDPDSVVREGEYNTIANSQAIPERIKGIAQQLQSKGKLTPETKKQLLTEAEGRIQTFENQYSGVRSQYEDIAKRNQLTPEDVFTPAGRYDAKGNLKAASKNEVPKIKGDSDYNALPSGSLFIDPFGKQRRKP